MARFPTRRYARNRAREPAARVAKGSVARDFDATFRGIVGIGRDDARGRGVARIVRRGRAGRSQKSSDNRDTDEAETHALPVSTDLANGSGR